MQRALEGEYDDAEKLVSYFAAAFADGATPISDEDADFLRSLPIYPTVGPSTQQLQVQ